MMATLTWTGSVGDGFYNVANWQPPIPPRPGDTLDIANGYVDVPQGSTLDGLTIILGGQEIPGNDAPIEAEHVVNSSTGWVGTYVPSPDPTLGFEDGSVIDASTTIQMPESGRSSANGATLWMHGDVVNNGTIGLPTNTSSEPQVMNLAVSQDNSGGFTNNGVINIPAVQTTTISGFPPPDVAKNSGIGTNNGEINVYGTLEVAYLDLGGTGTVTIGDVSNNLGLPPTIGQFIDDRFEKSGVDSGTIAFAGGHMTLNDFNAEGDHFEATISNFGKNTGDEISMTGWTMASESFNNGTLSIVGTSPGGPVGTFTMQFADLPGAGQFDFAQDGSTLDITWGAPTPAPCPVCHPVHHPVPHPSPITGLPPGYHLS